MKDILGREIRLDLALMKCSFCDKDETEININECGICGDFFCDECGKCDCLD